MATTQEQNERLTQIGPGTFMGNLLRRYWQPVGVTLELDKNPVKAVRVLGEDLTLYRDRSGNYGLIGPRCIHRGVSLDRGVPRSLRAALPVSRLGLRRHRPVHRAALRGSRHPRGALQGPHQDRRLSGPGAGRDDLRLSRAAPGAACSRAGICSSSPISIARSTFSRCRVTGCSAWTTPSTRCTSNFCTGYLGTTNSRSRASRRRCSPRKHVKIAFDVYRFGIMKRRLLEGEIRGLRRLDDRPPADLPAHAGAGLARRSVVPIPPTGRRYAHDPNVLPHEEARAGSRTQTVHDDVRRALRRPARSCRATKFRTKTSSRGSPRARSRIAPRSTSPPATPGFILYHKLLVENAKKVENGEDPMGTIRDPAENEPWIEIPRENHALVAFRINRKREEQSFDVEPDRELAPR